MRIGGGRLFRPDGTFVEGDLFVEGDRIVEGDVGGEVVDATGCHVIPGLTDVHFHAAVGHDLCDGTEESLRAIADYELSQGVTTICPASMTFDEARLERSFDAVRRHDGSRGARIVGINMEGPFVSPARLGAQNPAYVRAPDVAMFERLQRAAGGLVRLVGVAPEVEGGIEFIEAVSEGVRVSLAHTDCDYECARRAFDAGARQLTHTFNAMPALLHRAPGPIGAAADDDRVSVELICDGLHVHPAVVRAAFRLFGAGRVIMVSDTMEAAGLSDGEYELGGQRVHVRGRLATLDDGTIAGSVTNLMACLRCAVGEMGIPLGDAVRAAAANPARAVGVGTDYGTLEAGKVANVVVLDDDLQVRHVIREGVTVF